ncbi:MAG: tRNA (guanosine(37)-N1)-methyltransferase TrmD [Deltaproteobacteria bacterium RIFCSPHIGHO2_12_FULL_43_9]|nr:MAG: tRNA (guanosine(37)-N1)-methyltransferase TrmD [Deltaproteobacteria bacterium RIFCSPHIGHO2_12_FULL_43_9]
MLNVHNLRDYSTDKNRCVDDVAYGGGGGMVFSPQPLVTAIRAIRKPGGHVVLLSPSGVKLTHKKAEELSRFNQLVLICGRYEGVDQRVIDSEVDEEISIGDFVLTGGEIPAMILIETVSRFIPGVVGNQDSAKNDSFVNGLLEYPHYTRPAVFEGAKVPDVLLSGDHKEIVNWRREEALKKTMRNRPELLTRHCEDARHCERSEAISSQRLLRRPFGSPRNDVVATLPRNDDNRHSERSEESKDV